MNLATPPDLLESAAPERTQLPNLQDYLRVVFRYKWGVLGLALVGGLLAALKAYSDIPVYRATATMLIEREPVKFVSIDSVAAAQQYYDFGEYYQTQYEILRSRPLAERVVAKLGVEKFRAKPVERGFSWRKLLPGKSEAAAAPAPPPDPKVEFSSAVGQVLGGLSIQPIRNSQLVKVSFDRADPEFAAELANTMTQAYVESILEGRIEMAEAASTWLNERMSGLRQKLEESEKALQDYRDKGGLIDVKGVDTLATTELNLATTRLAEARRERVEKESIYGQVRSAGGRGEALEKIPGLLSYPLVSELKSKVVEAERQLNELAGRYGPRHPKYVEAQANLDTAKSAFHKQLEQVADGIAKEYQAARDRENAIAGELGSAKGEIRDVNRKQYELQRLQREVDSNRQLYEMFQTRFKETSASNGVQNANARLIESALVPGSPIYPDKRRATIVGLLVGLALGVALAFMLDHLDNTLKGAEDVERRLGISVLGMLPKLATKDAKDRGPLRQFSEAPKSTFSEAIRTVRTSVMLSAIDQRHKRILVTSSVPSEGKTTLSVNLAQAMGQMRKVLLIDADMRRPAVHRGLPELADCKGLSHFVAGEAQISECIRQIGAGGVYVMPAGPVPPNPQELLQSRRFEEALGSLSNAFDHVVIDCAPTLAVSDALVLSRLVHAVVYVVRSDSTPWQLVDQGLKRLRRANAPLIGAVVNHVVPRKSRYGYGYGYGKYYYSGDSYYHDYGYGSSKKS